MTSTSPAKPHRLIAPLDVSKIRDEKGVKKLIRELLNFHGWFTWMPSANGYGTAGCPDHLALKDGTFLAVEAKFGYNKPSALQKSFAGQIIANSGFAFCVNERNIDHLAWWLESYAVSVAASRDALAEGRNPEEATPVEHGSRMVNAMAALTGSWS